MQSTDLTSLNEAPVGVHHVIHSFQSQPDMCQRLRELGFGENISIRTIAKGSAQLICLVGNTRIGIHHRIAKDILVARAA